MDIEIVELAQVHLEQCVQIWNEVVKEGRAFPQLEELTPESGFFSSQTVTAVAVDKSTDEVLGMYILHPNNVGRCAHICNASYAVKSEYRGRHIGEALVRDCMERARVHGFRILQFNAVVKSNEAALNLYKKLGFTPLGVIPKGFKNINGEYEDIVPHYIELAGDIKGS